ncbi:MBL fold metallo-hydrolase [Maritalea porphyrae]|uniref:MBL fold metallo-hydrolase n=1 Tax=Maritalea porphyrae TaxID=880732 RepID=A0ABQ5UMM4_9HYPH|nr:MBL fold metallo-hydrolase [Maritalea porphyrae]GLQ16468.1 MBL fold metallo-hydrolase [Maritalea porphyrae]
MTDTHNGPRLSRRMLLGGLAAAPVAALGATSLVSAASAQTATPEMHPMAEFSRRTIGDIEVIALADGYATLPLNFMPELDQAKADKIATQNYKTHNPQVMNTAINGFIIRTADRTIAVDAGAPGFLAPTVGAWHNSLAIAGIDSNEIDTLFLTHAHADHVAAMTGQNGERLFPNAGLVLSEAEWAFAHNDSFLAQMPEDFQPMFHYARAQLSPYANGRDMISMSKETEIAPGVTAVPMPGHTPGHMGLRITSGNQSLMIWGDLVHAPAYQFAEPDWGIVFDADMEQAKQTRAKLLDQLSAERTMVAGMHLDFPALGYVERAAENYRYLTAPRDYGV